MRDAANASDVDRAMMQQAIELAEHAGRQGEVPVGAVVYRDGQVLGQGRNRREVEADPTAHAEIIAMREAARKLGTWRLDDCALAVTLEPCPMCAGAMVNARLGRVVYGCDDPKMGCVRTLYSLLHDSRLNHRVQAIAGVEAEACAALLRAFFAARRGGNRPDKPRPGKAR